MTALYAYGLVYADTAVPPTAGIGGEPLVLVAGGCVSAVAGPVDVAQFEGAALEANLAAPGWLESVVRAHEHVVEVLAGTGPVLPMRFGSIFSDRGALRSMLEDHGGELGSLLDAVRGRVELGVTVRLGPGSSTEEPPDGPGGGEPSGRDYLRRRKAALEERALGEQRRAELADALHADLAGGAERSARLALRRGEPDLVLNATYLVSAGSVDDFMERAAGSGSRHGSAVAVAVSGPWPPYSFVSVDVAGPHR